MTGDVPEPVATPDEIGFEYDGSRSPCENVERALALLADHADGVTTEQAADFVWRYVGHGMGTEIARRAIDEDPELSETFGPATNAAAFMGGDSQYAASPEDHREAIQGGPEATGGPKVARPTAALPLAQLDALGAEQRRREAKKRGLDWPTTDEARDRLRETIFQAMRHGDGTVIDAPTSLGKTHTVATTRWGAREDITGGRPVVHLLPTRDARDEAAAKAREHGGGHAVLRSRHEACHVAAGDHDPADEDEEDPEVVVTIGGEPASEWIQTVCDGRGVPFSAAHRYLEENNDQGLDELPCCEAGEHTGECDATAQWDHLREDVTRVRCDVHEHTVDDCPDCWDDPIRCDEVGQRGHSVDDCSDCYTERERCDLHDPDPTDPDHTVADCPDCYDEGGDWTPLIIATHNFAHVPGLRYEKNVVFDEEVDFTQDLSTRDIQKTVAAYLREIEAPAGTWEQFIKFARGCGSGGGDFTAERDALQDTLGDEPDREWYFEHADAHTLAPALAKAIWYALQEDIDTNGRRSKTVFHEPPRLDAHAREDTGWNLSRVTVVLDDNNDIDIRTVRTVPHLNPESDGGPRSVIGLDAHPSLPKWQVNTEPWIQATQVLNREERQLWRRYERGLRVVQVGDATRPLASGEYYDSRGTRAVVGQLRECYGADFRTAITADKVEDRLEKTMQQEGVADPALMHYGEEKSRNDFADESIGFVLGCIDPGDDHVLDLLAELGCDAEPERTDTECDDCGGDGCHECLGTGLERAHGRGFTGPDADTAQAILASVRENHTAQAAGRYARNPDDPEATATVFVRTNAMPERFADVQVEGAAWVYTDKQEAVVEVLREATEPITARAAADRADVSKRTAQRTLNRLAEYGIVDEDPEAGPHGATLYADTGVPDGGVADLAGADGEIATGPVWGANTWAVAISSPSAAATAPPDEPMASNPRETAQATLDATTNGGDPPPDDPA